MPFSNRRPRRLRSNSLLRDLVAETDLAPARLVAPVFVKEAIDGPVPVATMPGVVQHTLESLAAEAKELVSEGIGGLIVFGIPAEKDPYGRAASDPDGIVQRAVYRLREDLDGQILVITDLCLDEYTDHGHCGIVDDRGRVLNDETLDRYREIAVAQAEAGSEMIAPSGMMDGQVAAIREALDASGHTDIPIMAYSAKYASSFYGPFRDAAECTPAFGDRRAYQIDPRNAREAITEALLDEEEGADILMVKPAGPYLDVLRSVRDATNLPLAAYQVSGEYSALRAASEAGYLDGEAVMIESLTGIRRAGADIIITYFALQAARALTRAT